MLPKHFRLGLAAALLVLLAGCVSSPLGPQATVNLYSWDNRVVPFYTAETSADDSFGGVFDGAIFLNGVIREVPELDRRPETPYLLEVCNTEALCYYLVLFPGDFSLRRGDFVGGFAVVTEVSTAIYHDVKDLDAHLVRDAADALAAKLVSEDIDDDGIIDYSDLAKLDHFDRGKQRKQLRDENLLDALEQALALGAVPGISEITPIEIPDDLPLELYDPACLEQADSDNCEKPDRQDLCEALPGERDCSRIPRIQCLLFPDQPPCNRLGDSDFCADKPSHGLCRGERLDELCMRAPQNPVCLVAKDPEYCAEYPDDPFCSGFPDAEDCIQNPLNPLCGKAYFDEFCAMAPDAEICLDPPVGRVCRINPDSVFCDRSDDDEYVDNDKAGGDDCEYGSDNLDCEQEDDACGVDPTASGCEDKDDESNEDDEPPCEPGGTEERCDEAVPPGPG